MTAPRHPTLRIGNHTDFAMGDPTLQAIIRARSALDGNRVTHLAMRGMGSTGLAHYASARIEEAQAILARPHPAESRLAAKVQLDLACAFLISAIEAIDRAPDVGFQRDA